MAKVQAIPKNAVVAVEAKDRTMVSLRKLGSDFTPPNHQLGSENVADSGEHMREIVFVDLKRREFFSYLGIENVDI